MSAQPLHPAGSPGHRGARSTNSRVLQLAAFALTFILVALLVVTSSRAAFVAQNDNLANTVTSASVDLTDNDAGSAMFTSASSAGLMPGTDVTRCIEVTYDGNVDPLPVLLYATAAPTGDLAPYLNLTIDVAAANDDGFGTCTNFGTSTNVFTGTLATFASAHASYAGGAATGWDPTGTGQARTFRFTISVQNVSAAENKSTTFGFSWETRTS